MQASALRLLAQDEQGLALIAAAVQDALVHPENMKLDRKAAAFGLEINRFQWERAGKRPPYYRSRAMLAFQGVQKVRSTGMPTAQDSMLSLLDVRFTPAEEPPAGTFTLVFAGDTLVQIVAECVDVALMDTGKAWPTRRKPDHGRPAA